MDYQSFKAKWLDKGVDRDQYAGWQCWDGVAEYQDELGTPVTNTDPKNHTGYVRDIWEMRHENGILDYYDEVETMEAGDIAVFMVVAGWTPCSHIAIFDSDAGGGYGWFFGQNQGSPITNPEGGSAFNLVKLPYSATYPTAFRLKKQKAKIENQGGRGLKRGDKFIDVSAYQSGDLGREKSVGTDKTIIKVSEGTGYLSPVRQQQADNSNPIAYYHFARFGGDEAAAQAEANYFISHLPNKKVTYLVCDYEDGASGNKTANTNAVLAFMDVCASHGYKPIYYSYKPFTLENLDDYHRILDKYPNSLWIASYADYNVRADPLFEYFPSMDGIRWWQFTSTGIAGGLDLNYVLLDDDAVPKESAKPTAKFSVETVNRKKGEFAIRMTDINSPDGVAKVLFPTWTEADGQDDLIWNSAVKQADDSWLFVDNIAKHKNGTGKYIVHAYIVTPDGVNHGIGATSFDMTTNSKGTLKLTAIDKEKFEVSLTGLSSEHDIKGIKFPTWTAANGQDDIKWVEGIKHSDGSYTATIYIKDHGDQLGEYIVHCYGVTSLNSLSPIGGTKLDFQGQASTDAVKPAEILIITPDDIDIKTKVVTQSEYAKLTN